MSSKVKGNEGSLVRPYARPFETINPRPFLVPLIRPPVELGDYPALPVPPSADSFSPEYAVTSHVFPAAYPRCPSDTWVAPPTEEISVEKRERIAKTVAYLGSIKEAQENGRDSRAPRGEILWTVAKRYVKLQRTGTGGITLVLLHGIGAFKESWEPILHRSLCLLRQWRSSVDIEEIWCLDCVQHGDSGLVNESVLGDIFDNADYARDVVNFMLSYLPEKVEDAQALPVNLPRLPDSVIDARKLRGISARTVVAIGHSMGAHALIYPAVQYPSLFSSLVLIEAAVYPTYLEHKDVQRRYEAACMGRRWIWNTRDSAVEDISRSGYFRPWDHSILQYFYKYAIVETTGGKYRLKTHPFLESLMLFERRSVYETWEMLAQIDPHIFLHWIWGGKSERTGGPLIQAQTTFRRAENCSNDYHPDLRHNIPQEAPAVVATDIAHFLDNHYGGSGSRL